MTIPCLENDPIAQVINRWFDGKYHTDKEKYRQFLLNTPQLKYGPSAQNIFNVTETGDLDFSREQTENPSMKASTDVASGVDQRLNRYRLFNARSITMLANLPYNLDCFRNPDFVKYMSLAEILGFCDPNTNVGTAVHALLCWGSITLLGTFEQRKYFLDYGLDKFQTRGSFSMTELGRGSNVRSVETTAHYHPETDSFTIHTPSLSAKKAYIGLTGLWANFTIVFAQLIIQEKDRTGKVTWVNKGPHCFAVTIRDPDTGKIPESVTIEGAGPKLGLNGVDNGVLSFWHYSVPRRCLLNRYGNVDPPSGGSNLGKYSSPIKRPGHRFSTMLDALTITRLGLTGLAIHVLKVALATATSYAIARPAFGPSVAKQLDSMNWAPTDVTTVARRPKEFAIFSYPAIKASLVPYIASLYVMDNSLKQILLKWGTHRLPIDGTVGSDRDVKDSFWVKEFRKFQAANPNDVEASSDPEIIAKRQRALTALIAAMKAYVTWTVDDGLMKARRVMGAFGYMKTASPVAQMLTDANIFETFEGSNMVLHQQVAKDLLSQYAENTLKIRKVPRDADIDSASFRKQIASKIKKTSRPLFQLAALFQARVDVSSLWHVTPSNVHKYSLPISSYRWRSNPAYLESPPFILSCLQFRENRLLYELTMNLFGKTRGKRPKLSQSLYAQEFKDIPKNHSYAAWHQCLPQILQLSVSHIERVAYEWYMGTLNGDSSLHYTVDECASHIGTTPTKAVAPKVKSLLHKMSTIFGLWCLQKDSTFFLEHNIFSTRKSKALREHLHRTINSISNADAASLVNGFGVPWLQNIPVLQWVALNPVNPAPPNAISRFNPNEKAIEPFDRPTMNWMFRKPGPKKSRL